MAQPVKTVDESQALVKGLESALPELKRLAPRYVNLQRLLTLALEAKLRNPLLAKTSLASIVAFCKRCAEWGTDRVGAGGVWPVPFWDKNTGTYNMTPIPDWRLLIAKAIKAKAITHATAEAVYEHDEFDYERGLNLRLVHRPKIGDRGTLKAVYCVYTLPDGTKDFVVMSYQEDVIPIRDRTNAWRSWLKDKRENPWVTHPEEQSKKTVVKRAMKLFEGASIELTALLEADNAVMGYADLTPPEPISMPVLVESEPTATTSAAPPPASTEAPRENALQDTVPDVPILPHDAPVTTIIKQVIVKNGTTNGKAWTKYSIVTEIGVYGTFDLKIGEAAQALTNSKVMLSWQQDGKYQTCTGIEPVVQERSPGEEG